MKNCPSLCIMSIFIFIVSEYNVIKKTVTGGNGKWLNFN